MSSTAAGRWGRRALRWPALHFAVLGALLYGASFGLPSARSAPSAEKRLEIPASRVELLRRDLLVELGVPPSEAQVRHALDGLIDDEVLLRHALELGLDREPTVERRLAQLASFLDSDGSSDDGGDRAGASVAALADQARALGLERSDRVVRNILIDRATRLIRAAVLSREPSDEALERYRAEHADAFRTPSRIALIHVELRTGDDPRGEAERLLGRLIAADPGIEAIEAGHWGDRPSLPAVQPLYPFRELARRFGHGFAQTLDEATDDRPDGWSDDGWTGPIRSRYGWHLVKVTAREPGTVPPLDDIRADVAASLLHDLAERWLAERLRTLRDEYTIRVALESYDPSRREEAS